MTRVKSESGDFRLRLYSLSLSLGIAAVPDGLADVQLHLVLVMRKPLHVDARESQKIVEGLGEDISHCRIFERIAGHGLGQFILPDEGIIVPCQGIAFLKGYGRKLHRHGRKQQSRQNEFLHTTSMSVRRIPENRVISVRHHSASSCTETRAEASMSGLYLPA